MTRICTKLNTRMLLIQSKYFKYILLIMLLQSSHSFFSPVSPSSRYPHSLQHSPLLSSCPWVVHISSLASPFPLLFLTSPCLFCTYHLCFFFPVPLPPLSPLPLPSDLPPCDHHFCNSVPILVVWLGSLFV